MRLNIISIFDGQKAATAYMVSHLENNQFRKIVIEQAMEEKKLDYALQLCLDGEIMDKDYGGLVWEWKNLRFGIYERQGEVCKQKELAMDFVLNGKFDYFIKLKELCSSEEWAEELPRIISVMESGRYNGGIYVQILIHEKLTLKLLDYCKRYISRITDLYPHIGKDYKEDVRILFETYILQEASSASSRSHYQNVCRIIKHYKKACGAYCAGDIKNTLLAKYPRRPAFIDELTKLNV